MIITQTIDDLANKAAHAIAVALTQAIKTSGKAALMVSGGSSPKPLYQALSHSDVPWDKVTIGLVDDRWVDPGQDGSNETFIRETLLQNRASKAAFIGLKTPHAKPVEGLDSLQARLAVITQPFTVCVMGMGSDGHTASWFPQSGGLSTALDIDNPRTVCAIDATGCPVAGDHTDRVTLTLTAVMSAAHIVLFIPGAQKQAVFQAAQDMSVMDAPVKALYAAQDRLSVYSCP